ncbi:hypothetical protein JH06_1287 [Blastocystis sp. subtype 4]|uniref:hypothetical protein n=1 Tax=Blastocystis sp. subtype 4 TaxID=944170 RepID=UPI000712090E|nr:hypothetical protein JH06_1287 [Blastocystis sp. subtype 4]KNB45015.1 hypothetical protein JH06_1287 [Blastocystis sp. subtype 4]|eukprot:XP_014528458.1 hypothetical protein JH06_1287 [Blastocystis sp. subtype 4]
MITLRRLFYQADKDVLTHCISTLNSKGDFKKVFEDISVLYNQADHSTVDTEYFWSCVRDIIAVSFQASKNEDTLKDILSVLFDHNTESSGYNQYITLLLNKNKDNEERSTLLDLLTIEKKKRKVSEMIERMEDLTCGLCILEKKCRCKVSEVIQKVQQGSPEHTVEAKYMLTSLLMLREQVNPSSVSEDSFVETVSFPSILKPVNSHPPQVQYEVPRLSKKRIRWTLEEEERLIKGVNTYGEGRWTDIRRIMHLTSRTNVEIKDKWRNLKKKATKQTNV